MEPERRARITQPALPGAEAAPPGPGPAPPPPARGGRGGGGGGVRAEPSPAEPAAPALVHAAGLRTQPGLPPLSPPVPAARTGSTWERLPRQPAWKE